jgi:ribose 1,5-bisphosphokinase
MTGAWVFVCGASGAGKDSVIDAAQQRFSRHSSVVFARHLVTRPSEPGSVHEAVAEQDFRQLMATGGLCWHWQAHGFFYGIEVHYAADVKAGNPVVVNGSRAHVNGLVRADDIKVVEISASREQLATRLQQRGRDDPLAIASRLARNSNVSQVQADCVVVNDASLAAAGQKLADYLSLMSQHLRQ